MEEFLKWLRRVVPIYEMLRNSRSRLFFRLAVFLYCISAFLHADFESSFWGVSVYHRPELSYTAFALACLLLLVSIGWSIFFGRDVFPSVTAVLKHYVGRNGGLDFAAYFRDARDLSKVTSYHNADEIEANLHSLDITEVTPGDVVKLWFELAQEVHGAMANLDQVLAPTLHGHNLRVILDTEQGGLFYTRIDGKRFVFGATLDQPRINNGRADKEMRSIRDALQGRLSPHAAQP